LHTKLYLSGRVEFGHNGYGIRSTKDYKRKEWIDINEGIEYQGRILDRLYLYVMQVIRKTRLYWVLYTLILQDNCKREKHGKVNEAQTYGAMRT